MGAAVNRGYRPTLCLSIDAGRTDLFPHARSCCGFALTDSSVDVTLSLGTALVFEGFSGLFKSLLPNHGAPNHDLVSNIAVSADGESLKDWTGTSPRRKFQTYDLPGHDHPHPGLFFHHHRC